MAWKAMNAGPFFMTEPECANVATSGIPSDAPIH